jgi:lysine/ornithine N-monooxygenase
MTDDRQHETLTMARLLSEQGHWQRAADICRHLLQAQPGRKDVAEVLVEAERRAQESSPKTATELAPLFQEWIDLLFKYKRLRQLRRLSRKL